MTWHSWVGLLQMLLMIIAVQTSGRPFRFCPLWLRFAAHLLGALDLGAG